MKKIIALVSLLLMSFICFASEGTTTIDSGDTAWILISTALVLMMNVPALALFYGGMVKRKNILSTMYYSFSAGVIVSILWVVCLYSVAFGGNDFMGVIGGFQKIFLEGVNMNTVYPTASSIPEFVFLSFQLTFAIITVAIISGAVVERMNFLAWLIFAGLWALIVYAPLAHMVWNPAGYLFKREALDFAGGLVVHISSGASAIVAALFLGERVRYNKEPIIPNNIPYVFLGGSLLWVGWFGFNAGSALGANGLAGNALIVTNTSAAIGALTWILIEWRHHGKPSLIGGISGLVAGLVAITPAAGFVDVKASFIFGILSSIICFLFVAEIKKKFGYDDSLDAFGIHGIGGTFGAIATGIFANPNVNPEFSGLLYGNAHQLWVQIESVIIGYVWAIAGTFIILVVLKKFVKLRVEPQEEIDGLDLSLHGETAEFHG